jgi:predicted nucleotidyltransferase
MRRRRREPGCIGTQGKAVNMLLQHRFADPQSNLALELLLRLTRDFFEERLVSVVLYGSIVFDDLAPGYGDLDFVAVVDGDLSDDDCRKLVETRRPLRSGDYGIVCRMLEGAFLPRRMLNPDIAGKALWWGTSGERPWDRNQLGWLVLHVIRERGFVIWGRDVRHEIPEVSRARCIEDPEQGYLATRDRARGGDLHSVDWLLDSARQLLWLREGRLSSKSEAADWGHLHARGAWRELLPRAKELRRNPALADSPESQRWLDSLDEPMREARDELGRELALRRTAREPRRG